MGKYDALGRFLVSQPGDEVPMTFGEIERVLGTQLPLSARKHRPWWSNNPRNSVMTQVWLDAGFETEQVDMVRGTLVFRRVHETGVPAPVPPRSQAPPQPVQLAAGGRAGRRHPLVGALKGLLRVAPSADLTEPAESGADGAP